MSSENPMAKQPQSRGEGGDHPDLGDIRKWTKTEVDVGEELAQIANKEFGDNVPSPENLPRGIELGDWVSPTKEALPRVGSIGISQVVGVDPENPEKVMIFSPAKNETLSVSKTDLKVVDVKATEETAKKYNVPEHAEDVARQRGQYKGLSETK